MCSGFEFVPRGTLRVGRCLEYGRKYRAVLSSLLIDRTRFAGIPASHRPQRVLWLARAPDPLCPPHATQPRRKTASRALPQCDPPRLHSEGQDTARPRAEMRISCSEIQQASRQAADTPVELARREIRPRTQDPVESRTREDVSLQKGIPQSAAAQFVPDRGSRLDLFFRSTSQADQGKRRASPPDRHQCLDKRA